MKRRKASKKKAAQTAGSRHIVTAQADVDNPYFSYAHPESRSNPKRITATVNVRESAISTLASKGAIEPHQVAAATQFRRLWERMGGAGARAIDWRREAVDGGRAIDPINPTQIEAGRQLAAARKELGEYGYRLVGYIAGEGYSIHDLAYTRRQRDTMTDMLRIHLDQLATMWGFSNKRVVISRELSKIS